MKTRGATSNYRKCVLVEETGSKGRPKTRKPIQDPVHMPSMGNKRKMTEVKTKDQTKTNTGRIIGAGRLGLETKSAQK